MKNILFFILFFIININITYSNVCYTLSNGDWSDNIWSCGSPSNEDTIIINHNILVTDPNLTLSDSITLIINDTLTFKKGKLSIGCGSNISISDSGYINSDDNGNNEKINICSNQVWTSNDGPLSGPLNLTENGVSLNLIEVNYDKTIIIKEDKKPRVLYRYNMLLQIVDSTYNGVQVIIYDDGTIKRIIKQF